MSKNPTTTIGPPHLPRSRTAAATGRRRARAAAALVAMGVLVVSACSNSTPDAADAGTATRDATTTAGTGSPAGAFDAATVERLDGLVRQFQEVNQTPGVLIGLWSPQGTYVSATGVSDIATGAPLEPDMQFKIASQTKSFTGNLVLQLVSEGKVGLDDHVSKWIEGVPNGDEITIRQLLNHTSGLADGFTAPSVQSKAPDGCTVEELLTIEAQFPPVAEPGEKWSYSNYGFNLLGRVVEIVEEKDLGTVLTERITEPLGLNRTALVMTGSGLTPPYTHGYGSGELGPTQAPTAANDATDIPSSCLWAHGGMVSTLEDMHVWMSSMQSLVATDVWTEATTDPVPFVFGGNYNGPGQWFNALGFDIAGGFYVAEGSFAGYESASMYSPSLDTTIAVATTKMWSAINPPPMMQALAIALYGDDVDFGLTLDQAMEPNLGPGHDANGPKTGS
jgi:D-alanyl-D-alanine carboxypeptidase